MVSRLLGWLIANVSYGYREVPRYPEETLAEGLGDCDDQAILLVAMCRSLGIPAILQVGVIFNEGIRSERSAWGGHLRVEQRGVGWHGWALVYMPPWGWLPVDMTLVASRDPLSRIAEDPERQRNVVACFNVSRQEYVGDSILSRARLMSSELHVTVSDALISSAAIEEEPRVGAKTAPDTVLIIAAGSIVLVAVILIGRRWARGVEEGML
ncbi:hypothetical protein AC482_02850 [miscellaneous Crenarchaeota group-15 archaeon DG-45]|uniref:Transglutaminase-like domain-containing protein n=1 Tax=miscellaneous Crenarchaeota group-15 archaeon DG-45 TaxID=1685127 RepID=A0A0M0BQN1_9ARCH|nr:MAG: hypothetical protein AC482_02850 [miscellaneous Crenarchaeota group-15 archaeon DG-45]